VAELSGRSLLIASHDHWDPENNCYTLRVSLTPTTNEVLQGIHSAASATWETVFESTPCLPLSSVHATGVRRPSVGQGGRLIKVSDKEILLSLGDFGSFHRGRASYSQQPGKAYGKTILIDLDEGKSRIFSIGHRNPQGLVLRHRSEIWLTEHGPRGGDELNLVRDGRNYGFPYVTYGTDYESPIWPLNPHQGRHDGYEKPIFSWVPSIALSQVIAIEKDLFDLWRGDLIISTLKARSLYRLRIEDGRVIFAEPIPIGHRIRDIVEASDGQIVLKTDDDLVIFIRPLGATSIENLAPQDRGKFLAKQCQGCHTFEPDGASGIGPNLHGIVGRPIGSVEGYEYSEALTAKDGEWTADTLAKFVQDPEAFAPGTAMQLNATYTPEQLSDLIAYLKTNR